VVVLGVSAVVAQAACGSASITSFDDEVNAGSSGSSGASGSIGSSGSSGTLANGTVDAGPAGELEACATEQRKATPLPLDLYIMLDTSGSMSTQVAQSVSKYKAVSQALTSFVADKGSEGIGVGLQFFPLPTAGTPATCASSAQCPGATGPCSQKLCASTPVVTFCNGNADCASGSCITVGRCANAKNVYCTVGQQCGNDSSGFNRGICQAQVAGYCTKADSCAEADYVAPAVSIAALPGAGAAISSALAAKEPFGDTPTSAALKGAIASAKAYATAHPGHSVVAVLATDGLPTECDTSMANIAAVAGAALAASPSVKTFVVGVFAADEAVTAKANLDQIAAAGGTTQALIVTAGASTTAQFLAAMNTIRGDALPCEYALPVPESGTPDFGKMNVQHTPTTGAKQVFPNKSGAGACDAAGGWYYDVDPATGGTPTKIILCPTTCGDVKTAGGQVDVVVGCQTQVR